MRSPARIYSLESFLSLGFERSSSAIVPRSRMASVLCWKGQSSEFILDESSAVFPVGGPTYSDCQGTKNTNGGGLGWAGLRGRKPSRWAASRH